MAKSKNMAKPLIGIIMGSDSDLPVMQEAAKIVEQFGVSYELDIVSAHRTPTKMVAYAQGAEQRGIKVIIAGAGGAAHLPGMTAALTTLPVIGVPVQSKALSGVDSLYSIAQMPPGVPVATMAINGAQNAGLLALKILGTNDQKIQQQMKKFMADLAESVEKKSQKIVASGYQKYLEMNKK